MQEKKEYYQKTDSSKGKLGGRVRIILDGDTRKY